MKTAILTPVAWPAAAVRASTAQQPPFAPLLAGAWRQFTVLHFAVPPAALAPHVPLPLETFDGLAYVSVLSFALEELRPARGLPAWLGRALLRPVSEHKFLNVRTYVRGRAGPGIYFLAEWIDNPLSCWLGPLLYGLPYRLGRFAVAARPAGGIQRFAVSDATTGAALRWAVRAPPTGPPAPCAPDSLDEFLLERYVAYSHRRGVTRYFRVRHPPWRVWRADWVRCHLPLLEEVFPWFHAAQFTHAHLTPGLDEVGMGPPRRA